MGGGGGFAVLGTLCCTTWFSALCKSSVSISGTLDVILLTSGCAYYPCLGHHERDGGSCRVRDLATSCCASNLPFKVSAVNAGTGVTAFCLSNAVILNDFRKLFSFSSLIQAYE